MSERNDDGTLLPEHVTDEGIELGEDVDAWRERDSPVTASQSEGV